MTLNGPTIQGYQAADNPTLETERRNLAASDRRGGVSVNYASG